MKWIVALFLTVALVGCGKPTTSEVYESVVNGTVLVESKIDEQKGGIGTGFILDENMIVTNNHVIDNAKELYIYSSNTSKKYEAALVYTDIIADIAVLRIRDWDAYLKNEQPKILRLGDSDKTKIGDRITVIGHPWGLTWSASEGIISAKDRRIGQSPKYIDQVDAHLFNGNSGGPIFDENGNIVCVSNLMLSQEGGSYGFCIPSNLVRKVLYDLDKFKQVRWRVVNAAIGPSEDGLNIVIKSLDVDGAAAKAGLKEGDKILSIKTIKTPSQGLKVTSANSLINELAKLNGDEDVVELLIERNSEHIMFKVLTNYKLSSDYEPDKAK